MKQLLAVPAYSVDNAYVNCEKKNNWVHTLCLPVDINTYVSLQKPFTHQEVKAWCEKLKFPQRLVMDELYYEFCHRNH